MILKLKVCSKEDEFVHKNCTVCKDVGCYNKGEPRYFLLAYLFYQDFLIRMTSIEEFKTKILSLRKRDFANVLVSNNGHTQPLYGESMSKTLSLSKQNGQSFYSRN